MSASVARLAPSIPSRALQVDKECQPGRCYIASLPDIQFGGGLRSIELALKEYEEVLEHRAGGALHSVLPQVLAL